MPEFPPVGSPELIAMVGDGHDGDGRIVPQITRIAWLKSLLDSFEEYPELKKALLATCDDPDSILEMLRECRSLEQDCQAIINDKLLEQYPEMNGHQGAGQHQGMQR